MRLVSFLASAVVAWGAAQNVSFELQAPVDDSLHAYLKAKAEAVSHSQTIQDLIDAVTQNNFNHHILILSGEEGNQITRRTNSEGVANGIGQALDYVETRLRAYGFDTERHSYRAGWAPNLIATLRGTHEPDEFVILGAHIDDIPNTGRAPGANDDGSGSAGLLACAQAIFEQGASFRKTLLIEFYSGEEQGLVGSRALAARRRTQGQRVLGQFQQDMTAYLRAGDPVGVAFVQDPRATDPALTRYAVQIAREYAPSQLTIYERVLSGSSCCSDHQSYMENGFPSVGYIEPRGYTGDPQYHRATDLVRRADYSTLQGALAARVTLAAVADLADINDPIDNHSRRSEEAFIAK